MIHPRRVGASAIALLLAGAGVPTAVAAQQTQTPAPAATPQSSPSIPGLNDYKFALPDTKPTPVPEPLPTIGPVVRPSPTPTPAPTPTSAASPTSRATPAPTPGASPTPRATPTPRPSATPTAQATPTSAPISTSAAAQATPAATATPAASATPVPAATEVAAGVGAGGQGWLPWAGGAVALMLIGGFVAFRRRREALAAEATPQPTVAREPVEPSPRAAAVPGAVGRPTPPAPAPVLAAVPRARLALALQPRRAGFNLITATAEGEMLVRNIGDTPVEGIRIGAALLEAGAGREGEVAAFFGQPVVRPATPPFALAPGEERRVRIVVARAREAIQGVPANGRTMFVPVVAVNVLHGAGEMPRQAARAFAIGMAREGSDRLVPFWLDVPPRMYDGLAARPYGPVVEQ